MTWYTYGSRSAISTEGDLLTEGSGQFYQLGDTSFGTPLAIRDPQSEASMSEILVSSQGATQTYQAEVAVGLWKSNDGPAILMVSEDGLVEQMQALAASAQSAADSAAAALALLAYSDTLLPAGGSVGDVLLRGPVERTGTWAAAPSGTGGGVTSFNDLEDVPDFAPAGHTHTTTTSMTDASTMGRNLVKATDPAAGRNILEAAPNTTVSFPGFGTSGTKAAYGNHGHDASGIFFTVGAGIAATNVQDAIAETATKMVQVWHTGDPDPTHGGTVPLVAGQNWIFTLGASDPLPTWRPVNSIVIRTVEDPGETPANPVTAALAAHFEGTGNVTTSGAMSIGSVAVGTVIIAAVSAGAAAVTFGVSNTNTNTWTQIGTYTVTATAATVALYMTVATSATSDAVTVTRSPTGGMACAVYKLPGAKSTLGNGGTVLTNKSESGVTVASLSGETVVQGSLVVTAIATGNDLTSIAAAGGTTATAYTAASGSGNPRGLLMLFGSATAPGTLTQGATWASARPWTGVTATFDPVA